MLVLRALLFHLVCYPGSAVVVIAAALGAPFSAAWIRGGAHLWAVWFVWCTRMFLGIRLNVRGRIPDEGVIVAFKHQSAFETVLTLYLFHRPAVIMKAELRKIPFWGYASARHGSIFVERGKGAAALKSMLRQSRARAAEGRPIIIFPEGTRVPFGTVAPLKAGLYGVYAGLGRAVVPVALDTGRLWTKSFGKQPGTVTLAFLPEIEPGLSREALDARVHEAINCDPQTADVLA